VTRQKGGWVYFMSDRYRGAIYTGVTADLPFRVSQHREGKGSSFCRRYGHTRLVYMEWRDEIEDAIRREKRVKKWRRAWKIELLEKLNRDWEDLFGRING
jgi:putative endonuclease